jgi:hypothetical protein
MISRTGGNVEIMSKVRRVGANAMRPTGVRRDDERAYGVHQTHHYGAITMETCMSRQTSIRICCEVVRPLVYRVRALRRVCGRREDIEGGRRGAARCGLGRLTKLSDPFPVFVGSTSPSFLCHAALGRINGRTTWCTRSAGACYCRPRGSAARSDARVTTVWG